MTRDKHLWHMPWRRIKLICLRFTGDWRTHREPRIAPEQIATEMKAASFPTISFFTLLALSCTIATFGLLANSVPAIISLLDLGVAMAAGAAGAFSLSRESIRNSIAGVAISVSLVPPLAVAGIRRVVFDGSFAGSINLYNVPSGRVIYWFH